MTAFALWSAALLLLALALLVPRLLRQRAPLTALAVVLGLPGVALLTYLTVGTPAALRETPPTPSLTLADAIGRLNQHLAAVPDDAQSWFMLGRAYSSDQQFAAAAAAFERAAALLPADPNIVAELAGALLLASGSPAQLPPRVGELLDRALSLDPDQQKALWLRGIVAMQSGQPQAALDDWLRLQRQLPADSQVAATLTQQIAAARAQLDGDDSDPARSLAVTIDVPAEFAAQLQPEHTLFVYAEPGVGRPMPIVVRRFNVREIEFPFELKLDDSAAMVAGRTLADFPQFVVRARLSLSGDAIPQAGDLHGFIDVQSDQAAVKVTIDSIWQ